MSEIHVWHLDNLNTREKPGQICVGYASPPKQYYSLFLVSLGMSGYLNSLN